MNQRGEESTGESLEYLQASEAPVSYEHRIGHILSFLGPAFKRAGQDGLWETAWGRQSSESIRKALKQILEKGE